MFHRWIFNSPVWSAATASAQWTTELVKTHSITPLEWLMQFIQIYACSPLELYRLSLCRVLPGIVFLVRAGPMTDEYFTLAIGGMSTILNNSAGVIHPGDMVAWSFVSEDDATKTKGRGKKPPRRIGVSRIPPPPNLHYKRTPTCAYFQLHDK